MPSPSTFYKYTKDLRDVHAECQRLGNITLPVDSSEDAVRTKSENRPPSDFVQFLRSTPNELLLAELNVCSLQSVRRRTELSRALRLAGGRKLVLGVTETWWRTTQGHELAADSLSVSGYQLFRSDRNDGTKGGGVALYVSESLKARRRGDLERAGVEALFIEIQLDKQ